MSEKDTTRRASLPAKAGGMSDVQLRRYNTPNNDIDVFSDDPIYIAFPDLREKMKKRTLTGEEYRVAEEAYKEERIRLLSESDSQYVRTIREKMFDRDRRVPIVVIDGNPWVHPP